MAGSETRRRRAGGISSAMTIASRNPSAPRLVGVLMLLWTTGACVAETGTYTYSSGYAAGTLTTVESELNAVRRRDREALSARREDAGTPRDAGAMDAATDASRDAATDEDASLDVDASLDEAPDAATPRDAGNVPVAPTAEAEREVRAGQEDISFSRDAACERGTGRCMQMSVLSLRTGHERPLEMMWVIPPGPGEYTLSSLRGELCETSEICAYGDDGLSCSPDRRCTPLEGVLTVRTLASSCDGDACVDLDADVTFPALPSTPKAADASVHGFVHLFHEQEPREAMTGCTTITGKRVF